jgi:hypothetical protein
VVEQPEHPADGRLARLDAAIAQLEMEAARADAVIGSVETLEQEVLEVFGHERREAITDHR